MPIVLDASTALSWCFEDEASVASRKVQDMLVTDFASVPTIWPLEVANILAVAERRGRIDAAGISEFLAALHMLDIRVDDATSPRALHQILHLARTEGLSAYDAAYLDLAHREGLSLATRDARLAEIAVRYGVSVITG